MPDDPHAMNATSRNDEVNARIGAQQANNGDFLYKLLAIYQPFNEWSNKANGGKIGNIETLRDGIHNSFGVGNMGIIDVSAFDPVLWFHHWLVTTTHYHQLELTFVVTSTASLLSTNTVIRVLMSNQPNKAQQPMA